MIGGSAANSAAQTQANAADQAAQLQNQQFQTTTANEQPFLNAGQNTLSQLLAGINNGSFSPSASGNIQPLATNTLPAGYQAQPFNYQSSPGYQFALNQGLQASENAASRVGGVQGGNQLKALTNYAVGSADQDYQQQFGDYITQQNLGLANQNQNFNQALAGQSQNFNQNVSFQQLLDQIGSQQFGQLQTVTGSGQNAAANLGALGATTAGNVGNDLTSAANAGSAAQIAGANATTGAINNGVNNLTQLQLLQLLGGGGSLGGLTSAAGTGLAASDGLY